MYVPSLMHLNSDAHWIVMAVDGIAKALEMFLGMIVEEAGKVTTERGSKKLEAYHLSVHALHLLLYTT